MHPSEADGFAARADKVRDAFNREFFRPETGTYATGSQACNVLPLFLGIVPQGREADVAAALNADVVAKDYHLSTGNLCTKYVPEQLTRYGYTDTAFKLITQTTYPSWGYMLYHGRNHRVGALGIRHKHGHEFAQPPHVRLDKRIFLQVPCRHSGCSRFGL